MFKKLKSIFWDRVPKPEGKYHEFAVLVSIINVQDELELLFEVRSKTLKYQPSEICFPGGKMEPGETPIECAIRETCEELNISPDLIEIYGPLDYLVMHHDMILYPFLGFINSIETNNLDFNKDEVSGIFTVPLRFFMETKPLKHIVYAETQAKEDFPYHMIPNGKNYTWQVGKRPVLFYPYQDHMIWGMTARIIHNLVEIIRSQQY